MNPLSIGGRGRHPGPAVYIANENFYYKLGTIIAL